MILIGLINVVIGLISYEPAPQSFDKIEFQLDAPPPADAGIDAEASPPK